MNVFGLSVNLQHLVSTFDSINFIFFSKSIVFFLFIPIPQPLHVPCFLVTIMSYDTHDSCNARVHCGFSFIGLFFILFIFLVKFRTIFVREVLQPQHFYNKS